MGNLRLEILRLGWGALLVAAVLAITSAMRASASTPQITESTTESAYLQAEALVRNHEWAPGLRLLEPLLTAEPNNLKVLNLTALALTGDGQISEADRYFERALRVDPTFLPALRNLGINEFNSGSFAAAERHLSAALERSPNEPVINLYAGQLAYRRGDFARAAITLGRAQPFVSQDANLAVKLAICFLKLRESNKALEMLSSIQPPQLDPESQFLLGVTLAEAGAYEPALNYLLAARESPANSYNTSFDLAVCYTHLNRHAEAVKVLEELIAGGHETAEVDNLLAEAYEGNHETQDAIGALRRAIALAPEDVGNYLDFASICIEHEDYPAASKVLDVGLRIHPDSDRLFFERAILYAVQDNFQLAEEDFKKASALSPEKDSTYKGLSILYLESGDAARAATTLAKRLKEKPNDPDLLYLQGEALLRSGTQPGEPAYRHAQAAFERSVEFNPQACLPHVSLGRMYLQQGRIAEAVSQLEQARAADPQERSTYWQLANAYRKLGETEKQKAVLIALKKLNDEERLGPRGKNILQAGALGERPAPDLQSVAP